MGPHYWKVGIGGLYEDACYKSINSSEFMLYLNTSMMLNIYEPYGQGILWGTPLSVVGYINDDCYPVENATVQWEFSKGQNSWLRSQDFDNQSAGWYNYTWTETQRNVGYYNLTMFADKEYYGPNQTLKEDAFFIALAPDILSVGIDKELGGWGETYDMWLRITDADNNYDNITLWKRVYNDTSREWGGWTLVDQKWLDQLSATYVHFYEYFTCADMGWNQFRFRAVDEFNFSDDSNKTVVENFVQLKDTYPVFKTIHDASAEADTGFSYNESIGEAGFFDTFNITIHNQNGTVMYFNLSVNGFVVSDNQSVPSGQNVTIDAIAGGAEFTLPGNQTIILTVLDGQGGSGTANYTSYLNYTQYHQTYSVGQYINARYDMQRFNITVHNENSTTMYFDLYVNGYLVAHNLSAAPGENISYDARRQAEMDFTLPGTQTIFVNVTDGSGGSASARFSLYLDYIAGVHEFYLQEDNVTIYLCDGSACSPASNTTVRRLGSQSAYLNIRIRDTDFGNYPNGVDTRFWVTEDFYNYTVYYDCTTASGGYCTANHDPDCDVVAGIQSWKLQTTDSCYQPLNSSTKNLAVYNQLYVNYTTPHEGSVMNRNLTYTLNVTVNDDCGIYINDIWP